MVGIELRLLSLARWSGRTATLSAAAASLLVVATPLSPALQRTPAPDSHAEPDGFAESAPSVAEPVGITDSPKSDSAACDTEPDVSRSDSDRGVAHAECHSNTVSADADSADAESKPEYPAESDRKAQSVSDGQAGNRTLADRKAVTPDSNADGPPISDADYVGLTNNKQGPADTDSEDDNH